MTHDWPLYMRHKLTGYHRRARPGGKLALCPCGWRDRIMRKSHRVRLREAVCFLDPRGHRWGGPEDWSIGPLDHEVGVDDDAHGQYRQCDRCYKVEDL